MCRWPLRTSTPLQSILWPFYRPHLNHFGEKVIFAIPTQSLSVYASTYLSLLTWASCNKLAHLLNLMRLKSFYFEIPSYLNFVTLKLPKMCDPILLTVMKMQPHFSQSSRGNATPSSGTSPLAYYQEVPFLRDILQSVLDHKFRMVI